MSQSFPGADEVPLFVCARCNSRHPVEDISEAQQLCKSCNAASQGVTMKCNYCKSEFQQETGGSKASLSVCRKCEQLQEQQQDKTGPIAHKRTLAKARQKDAVFKAPFGKGAVGSGGGDDLKPYPGASPHLTYLFETKFQHFKAFHRTQRDARGLNCLLGPVSGAFYRSSLPATPIATPLFTNQGIKFTEQSLRNRILLRSQSPHRGLYRLYDQPDLSESQESQLPSLAESDTAPAEANRLGGVGKDEPSETQQEQEENDVTITRDSSHLSKSIGMEKASQNSQPSSSNQTRKQRKRNR